MFRAKTLLDGEPAYWLFKKKWVIQYHYCSKILKEMFDRNNLPFPMKMIHRDRNIHAWYLGSVSATQILWAYTKCAWIRQITCLGLDPCNRFAGHLQGSSQRTELSVGFKRPSKKATVGEILDVLTVWLNNISTLKLRQFLNGGLRCALINTCTRDCTDEHLHTVHHKVCMQTNCCEEQWNRESYVFFISLQSSMSLFILIYKLVILCHWSRMSVCYTSSTPAVQQKQHMSNSCSPLSLQTASVHPHYCSAPTAQHTIMYTCGRKKAHADCYMAGVDSWACVYRVRLVNKTVAETYQAQAGCLEHLEMDSIIHRCHQTWTR